MGSRAVALVCRDAEAAARAVRRRRAPPASLYTRTGRPFFDDARSPRTILDRLRAAVTAAGLWDELDTDWLLLDAELLPWSLKASGLLRVAVRRGRRRRPARCFPRRAGRAGGAPRRAASTSATCWPRQRERAADAAAFTDAYRRYCWPTDGLDGVRLAPFQILAVAGPQPRRPCRTTSSSPGSTGWCEHDATGLLQTTRRLSSTPATRSRCGPASTGGWS